MLDRDAKAVVTTRVMEKLNGFILSIKRPIWGCFKSHVAVVDASLNLNARLWVTYSKIIRAINYTAYYVDNLLGPNARRAPLSYCHGSPLIRRLFFRDNYYGGGNSKSNVQAIS